VVVHRDSGDLRGCIESLLTDVERVIVVDNGGGEAAGRVAHLPGVTTHLTDNRGFGAAQNLGVSLADQEFALLMNPDARMRPDALRIGCAMLRSQPEVAAVQGVCRSEDGRPDRSQGRLVSAVHLWGRALGVSRLARTRLGRWAAAALPITRDHVERVPSGPVTVDSLSATALLIRRRAFEEVGGFDEGFFLYGEDLDLCARLTQAGWTLVALPVEWALHVGGGSFTSSLERELHWWRGTMRFAAKRWPRRSWIAALSAIFVRSLTWTPRTRGTRRAFATLLREARITRARVRSQGDAR